MTTLVGDADPLGVTTSVALLPPSTVTSSTTPDTPPPPVEDAEGLAVVRRLDFAALAPFASDANTGGFCDVLLSAAGLKVDVSSDAHVVAALGSAIFITNKENDSDTTSRLTTAPVRVELQSLQLLSDGSDLQLDDDELVTDVKWISTAYVGASYSSGVLRVFTRTGNLVFEQRFHTVAVKKLDVSRTASSTVGTRRVDVQVPSVRDAEGELWILYDDATIAILQLSELFAKIAAVVFGPAQASKFRKYVLRDQSAVVGALPCGPVRPTVFQSHPRIGVSTIISAGADPFLSFYHAGNDQNSIIHLAHIATAMASRAAGAVWSFAKSWGWNSAGEDAQASDASNSYAGASGTADDAAEHVAAPVGSVRSVAEDARRRSRCLALSPTGRLAAVTDTLGRVLLIDTSRMLVIRMWKGYRNAQCGWMHGREGATRPLGLYLVIYSAQRGIVEVWRARYGPRVFSFAVGGNARLFTVLDASGKASSRCVVLAASPSGDSVAELIELQPSLPNLLILMKYFTQNKLQEEKFLLHQITAGLHAFAAKKRADKHHVLEQDAIEPLLDDMASLSSTTTIETLLDLLVSSDMVLLSPRFLLKALEKIQVALKREMTSRIPTGPELSILWKTLWQHRILSAFLGLHAEFERSKRVALATIEVSSAVLTKHGAAKGGAEYLDESSALGRIFPWLELFRRAGYALDDDACANARDVLERAMKLTAWEFLELFSMPFSDPELPRRRDILALFEQYDKSEVFIRETLRTLEASVFRTNTSKLQRSVLLALAFTPVLSSVFAVQELQQVHTSIFVSYETHTQLFLEWFFALPLGTVLALPAPTSSSSLQRWLQPYFATSYDNDELATPRTVNARTLFPCSAPLAELFSACWKTTKLFHAFVLAAHCEWGEQQHAKRIEEATLGKVSGGGGGVRWRVLQDAIAKTVHLSLRLGRLGRLSVDAVEHVDEILRALALMQLNDGVDSEHASSSSSERRVSMSADSASGDDWVASMEHCRNASQMRDWQSVLVRFPQFADKDSLGCFRALLLCTAWNAERSDMHQLDDALAELEALSSPTLQAAMATHVWEKFIRVHVVTLISFWEESAAGRKPQRGLQPQIARRFFGIIKSLLLILQAAVSACASEAAMVREDDELDESDDASVDDDDDGEPRVVDDHGDRDDILQTQVPEHRMAFLTLARVAWPSRVQDLPDVFRHRWPPAHDRSSLVRSLASFSVHTISQSQLSDHLSLVLLLDSFAATSVTPVSIVKLFGGHGRFLCRPDSFVLPRALDNGGGAPSTKHETRDSTASVTYERTEFLKQLLRHDESLGVALAEAFGLSVDMIREEHVLFLYQSGRNELAELSLDRMRSPERLGLRLASIARARLSLILQRMKAEAEFAMLMSFLPADVFAWVVSESQPPLVADPQVPTLDRVPSLTGTHYLLVKCLALLPPHVPEFAKVSAMSVLVKDIVNQVKQHPSMLASK